MEKARIFTNSSSLSEARGMADVKPEALRLFAAIVLSTSSLTSGIDFFLGRTVGNASMPVKNGFSL